MVVGWDEWDVGDECGGVARNSPCRSKKSARSVFWTARQVPGTASASLFSCLLFFQFRQALADFLQIFLQVFGLLLQNAAFLLGSRCGSGHGVVNRGSVPAGRHWAEAATETAPLATAKTEALTAAKASTSANAKALPTAAAAAATKTANNAIRKAGNRIPRAKTSRAPRQCTLTHRACSISSWHDHTLLF